MRCFLSGVLFTSLVCSKPLGGCKGNLQYFFKPVKVSVMAKQKVPSQSQISQVMSELGRRGGKAKVKKGPATLSPERRVEIAKKAATARWGPKKKDVAKKVKT
jgi:hypothetical protein